MAPKKEKIEKVSASAQEDMVLQYLVDQNRPYSATDISANLHNKVTKSAAQKILVKLHEAKKIEGRVSGKQSVYHTIQDPDSAPSVEELQEMEHQTQTLRDETNALLTTAKELRTSLAKLSSSLSTAELHDQVSAMQAEKTEIEERLEKLRSGSLKPVSLEEKARVDGEMKRVGRCVEGRGRIVKDMWGMISEALPKEQWEDMKEKLGLEF